MDIYDANLRRQKSCRSPTINNWWSSGHRSTTGLGPRFIDDGLYYQLGSEIPRRRSGWLTAWKRLLKKKLNIFEPSVKSYGYDPQTYAQNFDGESFRLEPENLSRSFSAQFANPSGFLRRRL